MFNKNIILKLNKDILQRFEHNLNGGTIILYNVNNHDIWFGNDSAHDLLKLIDGKKRVETIYKEFESLYDGYSSEEIADSVNAIIKELVDKHFLVAEK